MTQKIFFNLHEYDEERVVFQARNGRYSKQALNYIQQSYKFPKLKT